MSAEIAARMLNKTWNDRPKDSPRDGFKVDAMIAAIAHRHQAHLLVTANARHFKTHLDAIESSVQLDAADQPKNQGQLKLFDRK